ncbi:uncharacterized protein K460DRAFT_359816 [Cucurbitaria berberidis CBS 394.84]|uniref:Uncharacterized protein n=1 Tax=Cucurbitaria berberidis CBS 394.84 TaxID=1168544 RepID=A0A9P4G6T0_9PLEO|nr:uncharacterized protein K460DRAFT_359816 [Cucurbitaria berberidis CBS 394.84]KAF1840088.1 hypothetical protein K460DRAFT_359816 [Cucurbitaria berberidis CBS 394.84]
MKALTFILALLGLLTITLACNEGEEKCCSTWFGCQCEGGKWVNKLGCQKGSRCIMKNGEYICRRRSTLSRNEEENIIGLPISPIAVPVAPIDAAHDVNTALDHGPFPTVSELSPRAEATPPMCSSFTVFCASSNKGGLVSYCAPGIAPKVLYQCAQGKYCVGVTDESKHVADLHCAKESPPLPPNPSPQPTQPPRLAEFTIPVDIEAKVYCEGKQMMYIEPGSSPEVVHTCNEDYYCTGNDNPWEGRIQLSCQYEDPAVSTPGHSHPVSTATPTTTLYDTGPHMARADPVPSGIAALIENVPNTAGDTADTSTVMCGFCINMQDRRSELTGIGVCNTIANDGQYRAKDVRAT